MRADDHRRRPWGVRCALRRSRPLGSLVRRICPNGFGADAFAPRLGRSRVDRRVRAHVAVVVPLWLLPSGVGTAFRVSGIVARACLSRVSLLFF